MNRVNFSFKLYFLSKKKCITENTQKAAIEKTKKAAYRPIFFIIDGLG